LGIHADGCNSGPAAASAVSVRAAGTLVGRLRKSHIQAGGWGLELTMILVELMFAIMLAAAVLIVIPLLLLMAGVAGVVLLWALAPTAVLVALVLWLVFPHAMAVGVLVFMLMIGFIVLSRRRQLPMNRW
jgi:hypothetical protein